MRYFAAMDWKCAGDTPLTSHDTVIPSARWYYAADGLTHRWGVVANDRQVHTVMCYPLSTHLTFRQMYYDACDVLHVYEQQSTHDLLSLNSIC